MSICRTNVPGATGDGTPPKTSSERIIAAAASRIAEESRRALPLPAVVAAPLPLRDTGPLAANGNESSTVPEGYSPTGFKGEMAKARIQDGRGGGGRPADEGPDWLGSPTSVETLVAQAAAGGRGWSFGWIHLAGDATRADLARSLDGTGAEIIGSAGRLLRVRLPGDEARLSAIAGLPGVDGMGALPADAKLRAFEGQSGDLPSHEPTPVFITLMTNDADGRWRRDLTSLGAVVGRYDPDIRVYTANVTPRRARRPRGRRLRACRGAHRGRRAYPRTLPCLPWVRTRCASTVACLASSRARAAPRFPSG